MSEWIEHDGRSVPVPVGVRYEGVYGDGEKAISVNSHSESDCDSEGNIIGENNLSAWLWKRFTEYDYSSYKDQCIFAYRIINDGEEAKREARSELFKKMIEGVAPVGGEPKLPAPKKKVKVSG